jgi:membrane associated rhomboid family serine protease
MVTRFLIILNVIGYLWEISVAGPGMLGVGGGAGVGRVLELGALYPSAVLEQGQWWRMLLVYVFSMVAAGLGIIYLSPPTAFTLGASGAIFGLFGALFAIGLKLGKPGMELVKANVGILILNLVITFTVPAISWQAHVCGLVGGFMLTSLIYYPPRRVQPVVTDATTGTELETEYQTPYDRPPL